MATYRKATGADRAKYLDFANYVFSANSVPHDFKTLIPKMYADGLHTDDMHFMAVDDENSVRGLVALWPMKLHLMENVLSVGYIGTVSVHPYARGEGHMKALMKMARQEMNDKQMDIVMLGGLRQRYQYFGYTKGGLGVQYTVTSTNMRHVMKNVAPVNVEFSEVTETDDARIACFAKLHDSQKVHVERKNEDFLSVARTWHSRLIGIAKDGATAGYMIASQDGGFISEMLLEDETLALPAIASWFEKNKLKRVNFSVDSTDVARNNTLDSFAEEIEITSDESILVLNWKKVLNAYLQLKNSVSKLADGSLEMNIEGETPLRITVKDCNVEVTEIAESTAPVMTHLQAQELVFGVKNLLVSPAPAGWLPLPVYLPSADHF